MIKRSCAVAALLVLASACGTSGSGSTTTRTVTRTVTASPTVPADASTPPSSDAAASAAPAANAAPDACSVLTPAQAEAIAGTPLLKPISAGTNSAGRSVMCQYNGPTTGPTAEVEVYIGDGAQQQLHIDRDNLKHTFTTVPGVGDECLQEDGSIFVKKNGIWASIRLVRLNDPAENVKPMQTGIKQLAAQLP